MDERQHATFCIILLTLLLVAAILSAPTKDTGSETITMNKAELEESIQPEEEKTVPNCVDNKQEQKASKSDKEREESQDKIEVATNLSIVELNNIKKEAGKLYGRGTPYEKFESREDFYEWYDLILYTYYHMDSYTYSDLELDALIAMIVSCLRDEQYMTDKLASTLYDVLVKISQKAENPFNLYHWTFVANYLPSIPNDVIKQIISNMDDKKIPDVYCHKSQFFTEILRNHCLNDDDSTEEIKELIYDLELRIINRAYYYHMHLYWFYEEYRWGEYLNEERAYQLYEVLFNAPQYSNEQKSEVAKHIIGCCPYQDVVNMAMQYAT